MRVDGEAGWALAGGNVAASVVRIGASVRKPVTRCTPAVHEVLRHLERAGFDGAPRALGCDASGRHILEFVPGAIARRGPAADYIGVHLGHWRSSL